MKKGYLTIVASLIFILAGCPQPAPEPLPPPPTEFATVTDSNAVTHTGATGNIDVTLNLSASKDVYFVLTTTGGTSPQPKITSSSMRAVSSVSNERTENNISEFGPTSGSPAITESNADLGVALGQSPLPRNLTPPGLPNFYTVGNTKNFITVNKETGSPLPGETVPITLRKLVTGIITGQGNRDLYLWVQDSFWWASGLEDGKITMAKLDALAGKFLKADYDNDIFDWVSSIYGAEWGDPHYSNLLPETNPQEIHIVLWDINNDASTSPTGGIVGYFWAKDNYLNGGGWNFSNQMINFSLDAYFFGKGDTTGTWNLDHKWPEFCISTLAHEFQHMINWYQGFVLRKKYPLTWINEMASMVTEDLVANKISADGPRGVEFGTPGSGTTGNINGRLPRFNYYNDVQLTAWYSGDDALKSYSIAYAFGAWLSRNFGGAELFKKIVQNGSDLEALLNAVDAQNGAEGKPTLAQLMEKWGAAVVLSSENTTTYPYKYNTAAFQTTTVNSIDYDLGGINLYNFQYGSQVGPYFWNTTVPGYSTLNQDSNTYVTLGALASGTHNFQIRTSENTRLTVVLK